MSKIEVPPVRPEVFRHIYEDEIKTPDRLQAVLDEFYKRMASDVMIGFFFFGKDLHHIAVQQKLFLLRAMGVAQEYSGKGPASAHMDLAPIMVGHFNRRLVILAETLRDLGFSERTISVWISFEKQFAKVVIDSRPRH